MEFVSEIVVLLFFIAFIAGVVDTIAGGGGLLTIPTLLYSGITPIDALATNKLQASFGTLTSALYFIRKKVVDVKKLKMMIFLTSFGSMLGVLALTFVEVRVLESLIPLLLVVVGLYFLFSPKLGELDKKQRISVAFFSFIVSSFIGFYDGFFGPGTGSFFIIGFVLLLGFNLTKALAHAKVMNFTSNASSLVVFIYYGNIVWLYALVMSIGQILGALVGSKLVFLHGNKLIRPLIILASFIMAISLLIK